jgi:dolichyl-phosphate-mannose-protein mannosyltransferase
MQLTKKDILSIVVLSIVFLALATYNLGLSQTPISTVTLSPGQSFYIDLGSEQDVNSVFFLLKDGSYNLTIYTGAPENWSQVISGTTYSDYYKWNEVSIDKTTQYLKVEFGQYSGDAIIAEVALTNSANEQIAITNAISVDAANPNVHNLIDEQNKVSLPPTYMTQTYFDEIYFARTAEQYLHLQSPYEWTHPPLGKLIQAAGIVMFGYSPFGWRLIGVIFGTLMIPVMYLLGKRLFGTWIGAFAAAFLLTFDFMHFTMARMGTADTYVVFFSLLSQLCFFYYFTNVVKKGWKTSVKPLFLAVVFFALGFSTKWLVLYGALGMLALLAAIRFREVIKLKESFGRKYAAFFDHPFMLLLGFICVAIGIYFLTYIPDLLTGRPILGTYGNGVIDLQFAMYNYHSTLVATHAFSSAWWTWPIMVSPQGYVPLWLDISYLPNSIDSTISVTGNPAIWWVGIACMITLALDLAGIIVLAKRLWAWIRKKVKNQSDVLTIPSTAPSSTVEAGATETSPVSNVEDDAVNETQESEDEGEKPVSPIETESPSTEKTSNLRNFALILAGFLIFGLTAISSEIINYHSFLLALPIYSGLFLAVYGMISNVGEKHEAKDVAPIFILTVFLFSWIPYSFISRVTFIYHFYVSVPFICLASAFLISKYWHTKAGKIVTVVFFASVVAMFVAFYPVISGMPTPASYIHNLKWFPSWYFAP